MTFVHYLEHNTRMKIVLSGFKYMFLIHQFVSNSFQWFNFSSYDINEISPKIAEAPLIRV